MSLRVGFACSALGTSEMTLSHGGDRVGSKRKLCMWSTIASLQPVRFGGRAKSMNWRVRFEFATAVRVLDFGFEKEMNTAGVILVYREDSAGTGIWTWSCVDEACVWISAGEVLNEVWEDGGA